MPWKQRKRAICFEERSLSQSRWKLIGGSNAIQVQPPPHDDLREELKRRIKLQTIPANAETAAMLFLALLASGQITMCKADGWQSLAGKPSGHILDLAAWPDSIIVARSLVIKFQHGPRRQRKAAPEIDPVGGAHGLFKNLLDSRHQLRRIARSRACPAAPASGYAFMRLRPSVDTMNLRYFCM